MQLQEYSILYERDNKFEKLSPKRFLQNMSLLFGIQVGMQFIALYMIYALTFNASHSDEYLHFFSQIKVAEPDDDVRDGTFLLFT